MKADASATLAMMGVQMNHTSGPGKGCCIPESARACAETSPKESMYAVGEPRAEMLSRMTLLQGGSFLMGTDYDQGFPDDGEGPVHQVHLDPFYIDTLPVTNHLFARFIALTGYTTEAERFGWSFVFWAHVAPERFPTLVQGRVESAPWWCGVRGARWNQPEGPGSDIARRADHPVVHVSWNDAQAFCSWSGQALPTEAQWEYAARGGLTQMLYPWGNKLRPDGKHRCNIWQGDFPTRDTAEDGYAGTCPVKSFPPNGFGLYSMTGNSWEWCSDWFDKEAHCVDAAVNPSGPASGSARVVKGGSFLCHHSYCNRYRVAARTSNTPDSTTSHMGFRCVSAVSSAEPISI